MLYRYPDYYAAFSCIADKCEATCCAGWQIEIDDVSLASYKEQQLDKYVNYEDGSFYQDGEKNCAFLRPDLLCNMVLTMGEDALCDTCRLYPRHIEEFENVREYSLSISCPEVARIILSHQQPVTYLEREDDIQEDSEDYDPYEQEIYLILREIRKRLFRVLAMRDISLEMRCGFILDTVWNFQNNLDQQDEEHVFDVDAFLENIDNMIIFLEGNIVENRSIAEAAGSIDDTEVKIDSGLYESFSLGNYNNLDVLTFTMTKELFDTQFQWEHLTKDWPVFLSEARDILYNCEHEKINQEFNQYIQQLDVPFTIQLEQIITYFLYTYFCGSAYDEYYYGQAKLTVVVAFQIKDLVIAKWQQQGRKITQEDICRIVYSYSRELEHSTSNVLLMEELLENIAEEMFNEADE